MSASRASARSSKSSMSSFMLPTYARRRAKVWFSNAGGMVPGVSSSSKPSSLIHCLPRVTPALLPVTVRFAPESRFITVLLPVLGTPSTMNLNTRS